MLFCDSNGIRYYTFEIFPRGILHGVFTRRGGVSPAPWDSLNVGGTVGDEREHVIANRKRSFETLGRSLNSMFDVWQVHSTEVVFTDEPRPSEHDYQKADIIFTDKPAVTLYMRFADCVPILLHDPKKKVVGIAHAGWLGTVRNASGTAVRAMVGHYGSDPNDILAAIGPSIGPDHYEVGPDVLAQIRKSFNGTAEGLIEAHGEKAHLDLWAANRLHLEQAGVKQVEVAGICTACHLEDWYSHRAEKGSTGRFGALIALEG